MSPSVVFPDIVYVDICEPYVKAIRNERLDARHMRIQDFMPDRDFDLLIVKDHNLPDPHSSRLLKRGHYICTRYQSQRLYTNPDFSFVEDLENPELGFGHREGYSLFRRV